MAVQAHHKEILLKIIHTSIPNCKVWLFGSRARDTEGRGSDIDLALDCGAPIPLSTIIDMRLAIQDTTLPMEVDLVDLNTVSDDFKKEVLKEAILWTS